jgi:hypothetical protein
MCQSTELAAARAISWETIADQVSSDIITTLQTDEAFMTAKTTRDQCYQACRSLRVNRHPVVPSALIGRILGIDRSLVKRHFQKILDHPNGIPPNGRPSILTLQQKEELIAAILDGYVHHRPLTIEQVKHFIEKQFHLSLDRGTLCPLLGRDPCIKSCQGLQMEEKRINVTTEAIMTFFEEAINLVQGVLAHFVLNMDDVPVSRAGKRITLMAWIGADSSF